MRHPMLFSFIQFGSHCEGNGGHPLLFPEPPVPDAVWVLFDAVERSVLISKSFKDEYPSNRTSLFNVICLSINFL